MQLKSFIIAASLFFGVIGGVSATPAFTNQTYSEGIITSGYDGLGLFGQVGANLAGNSYSETVTVDWSQISYFDIDLGGITRYGQSDHGISVTVTVNGVTYSADLFEEVASTYSYSYHELHSYVVGGAEPHSFRYSVTANQDVIASDWFWGAVRLDGDYIRQVQQEDFAFADFRLDDAWNDQSTFFSSRPSLEIFDSSVPEPNVAFSFALGLIGLTLFRRKSTRNFNKDSELGR